MSSARGPRPVSLLLLGVALTLTFAAPLAAHVTLFGPQTYTVAESKESEATASFQADSVCDRGPNAIYTLIVGNGNAQGEARVSSASIALNGVEVVSESELNQQTGTIERTIAVAASNAIAVKLKGGKKEGFITLSVRRHVDLTVPVFAEKSLTTSGTAAQTFREPFSVADPAGSFSIRVRNVAAVKSVSVTLNGVEIVSKQEMKDGLLVKPVTLKAANELAVAVDPDKAPATVSVSIVRHLTDTEGPTLTLTAPANGQVIGASPAAVSGKVTDPSGVASLTVNKLAATIAADGAFSAPVPLVSGTNKIELEAVDCEGNRTRRELTVVLDVAPPSIAIVSPANGAFLKASSVAVSGTASDDLAVASVSVNGQPATLSGNTWTATLTLADGARTITAIATDSAGKTASAAAQIVVDTVLPTITAAVAPAPNGAGWNRVDATVTFTCTDAGSGIATCSAPVVVDAETGSRTVTGTAADKAGNPATASAVVKLDKTAPSLAVTSPAPGATVETATVTISGTVGDALSGVTGVTCNGTAATISGGNFTCTLTFAEGTHDVAFAAADAAGNPATATARYVVVLDREPPKVTIAAPANGAAFKTTTVAASGTATDDRAVAGLTVNGAAVPLSGSAWSTTLTLPEGPHTITAVATDTASKTGSASVAVVVDLTAPAIAATVAPAPNAAGWNKADATVTFNCTDAGSGIANCSAPVVVSTETAGQTVTGTAADKAGHTASASALVKLDETRPVIAEVVPREGYPIHAPSLTISGVVSDALSGLLSLTCGGTTATINAGAFTCTVTLAAGTNSISLVATDIAGNQTLVTRTHVLTPDDKPPLVIANSSKPLGEGGWVSGPLTVFFRCSDAETSVASCSPAIAVANEGANQAFTGTGVDAAGNQGKGTLTVSVDNSAPSLQIANAPALPVSGATLPLNGTVTDALSGVRSVTCGTVQATLSGSAFQCSVPLTGGAVSVPVTATDRAGNITTTLLSVLNDVAPPDVALDAPSAATTNAATITLTGTATDNDAVASVHLNGVAATLGADGTFTATVPLTNGANAITATARDRAGNSAVATVAMSRVTVPAIAITAPADLAVVGTSTVRVTGTISDPSATIQVNGVPAAIAGNTFSADVPLAQGRTVVTATATSGGAVATASVNLYRDSIAPRAVVYDPPADAAVFSPAVTVSGMVDDIVVGTVNAAQVQLTVNGIPAQVSNRAFIAPNVPLKSGRNELRLVATDQAGNSATILHPLFYDDGAYPKLSMVSGNLQSGAAGATLPQPLVVRLADDRGVPIAGKPVAFKVVANNGTLAAGGQSGRSVTAVTDAQGNASATWTLGARAGAGNNRVEAHAEGFFGNIDFVATASTAPAHHVFVDLGDMQFGVVGAAVPRPLVAVVLDAAGNRIAGVPVTFTVVAGGGSFNGQPSVTVLSDSDGRVSAQPILGPAAGEDNNVFVASAPGVQFDATFTASGRVAGDPAKTRIRGVVLDNTDTPVPGVSLRIDGTSIVTQTGGNGQFVLAGVPVGYVKLFVDGSTATVPGTWPMLEFPMYTIAGQDNEIGMPVYLLPIDVRRGISVDDFNGGTLTIPELPGFSLTVAPGTATFPGGGRTGTVSVTLVHADKMPMLPSAGQQPRFIVTIQPPGVHFEPPAPISFPNVDGLAPGQIAEMFSFDHDLGQFVSIGTGTVSEDGAVIRSDPGVGIIKGGWHGTSVPPTTGAAASCTFCQHRVGTACVPNPAKAGKPCADDGVACTEDICKNGSCAHVPITIKIGGPTSTTRNIYVDRDDPSRTLTHQQALSPGQPVYSNQSAGDLVAWRAYIDNVSMRSRVTQYKWTATGPQTYTGPAASEWLVGNLDWKPGTYTINLEVRFDTGCVKTATYTQKVGIRTNDYVLYGSILDLPAPTAGVHFITKWQWSCGFNPLLPGLLILATTTSSDFNDPDSPAFVFENWPDRLYANYRLLSITSNSPPNPTRPDTPLHDLPVAIPGSSTAGTMTGVFGVDPVRDYRQAVRAQFKYLVEGGRIVGTPQRVGPVFSLSGYTTPPCLPVGAFPGDFGEYGPLNDKVEMYPDGTGFGYIMQMRAGPQGQLGYRKLNRRFLPYVYFMMRFSAQDGELHTRLTNSGNSPERPDASGDYCPMPTYFMFHRRYVGGAYTMQPMPGFPIYQNLEKFLAISPKDTSTGGPYYPP